MIKNFPIYINVGKVDSQTYNCFEIAKSEYDEIDYNLFKQFTSKQISDCVIDYFANKNEMLFIVCTEFIRRHIKSLDNNLQSILSEQKHNCFTIVIDGSNCFVWGSTPSDTKDYSEKHGAFLIKSYQDITKK